MPSSVREILSSLKSKGSRRNVAGIARYGIVTAKAYGVPSEVIKTLARSLGKDHALARDLWNTGVYDASILAAFVEEPDRVTESQMERWVRDFDNWAICDGVCLHLFDRTAHAHTKAVAWSARNEEFVRRAGLVLMAVLAVHDKQAPDDAFRRFLAIIKIPLFPPFKKGDLDGIDRIDGIDGIDEIDGTDQTDGVTRMDLKTVKAVELAGGIAILTLNRPERRNAISIEMRLEILECMRKWKEPESIGVMIITGSGDAFTAGFDLTEFTHPERFSEIFETSSRYHRDLWNFPKPTIAAVNGPALAGGFDLAKLCDIRICSPKAVFGHPEIKFGIPPLVTPLRWIIGEGLARHLCLTGKRIDAIEACRIGLVSEVVEGDKLLERAVKIATEILETPMEALKLTKKLMIDCAGCGFEEAFCQEHDRVFQESLLKRASESLKSK